LREDIMTMTLIWSGVALWFGLNAAFAARRIYATLPAQAASSSARLHRRRV
jgi:hypothetical protein